MGALLQRYPLVVALTGVALLLLVVVGLETGFGRSGRGAVAVPDARQSRPEQVKLLPTLAAAEPDRAYPETVARPLWIPTRRPAPQAPTQPAVKSGQYVLQGVIVVGANRTALLREKATGKLHRVEQGKELDGLKVAEIKPESVTLSHGDSKEVLPLLVQKAEPGTGAPQGASPGPFAAQGREGGPLSPGANPASRPPGQPANPVAHPVPARPPQLNHRGPALPQATTAPISPEELLARRRARAAQQNK